MSDDECGRLTMRLAEERKENEQLREFIAASKEVATARDVMWFEEENKRMRGAFKAMIDTVKAGGALEMKMSGCEWCGDVWPKPEPANLDHVMERARRHVFACPAHPLRIERDALRGLLGDAIDLVLDAALGHRGDDEIRASITRIKRAGGLP